MFGPAQGGQSRQRWGSLASGGAVSPVVRQSRQQDALYIL